jgi:hypothetical protein
MIVKIALAAITVVMFGSSALAEHSSDIAVSLTTLQKGPYHVGEPIAMTLSLRNVGPKGIRIPFWRPDSIGITFTRQGAPKPVRSHVYHALAGGAVPLVHLAPGEELRCVIALNRYLSFTESGRFSVEYTASYLGLPDVPDGEPLKYVDYGSKGELLIEVEPGAIDLQCVKDLIFALEQQEPSATSKKTAKDEGISKEDAAELLQWAETPIVIEPLIKAAHDIPNASASIMTTLQKFFKQHDRARSGILEVAKKCGLDAFQAALAVYEKEGVVIPGDWFKSVLTSDSTGKIYMSLEYLRKHGAIDDVNLVEPLTKSKNKQIADLAAAVVNELKTRPPAATPPVAQPDRK